MSNNLPLPQEEWKSVEGFEGIYEVSNMGRVKSLKRTVKTKTDNFQSYHERILKHTTKPRKISVSCTLQKWSEISESGSQTCGGCFFT